MSPADDQILIGRSDLANASFWLDQIAVWLADPDHADRFACDLWAKTVDTGPPLTVIVARAAAALRETLSDQQLHVIGVTSSLRPDARSRI